MKKNLGILAMIAIIALGWFVIDRNRTVDVPDDDIVKTQVPEEKVFAYQGREGVDAMTLLKENFAVETQEFGPGLGEFATKIEGIAPTDNQFWGFFVNGETSNVGASTYITKDSDTIEWKLEEIGEY